MEENEIKKIHPVKSAKGGAVLSQQQYDWVKETVEGLLQKMSIIVFSVELTTSSINNSEEFKEPVTTTSGDKGDKDLINLNIKIEEPQVLIGKNGQTLFELERLLRIILNKKLKKEFYLKIDINDYKKKKIEYLKNLAADLADEVSKTQEKKTLSPMPAYERRVIHMELSKRQDIITESQGEGDGRHVTISPR